MRLPGLLYLLIISASGQQLGAISSCYHNTHGSQTKVGPRDELWVMQVADSAEEEECKE